MIDFEPQKTQIDTDFLDTDLHGLGGFFEKKREKGCINIENGVKFGEQQRREYIAGLVFIIWYLIGGNCSSEYLTILRLIYAIARRLDSDNK